jgi:Tn3 transposase DDE domain
MMTPALHKLRADGVQVGAEEVAALSPYIRSHISRFGQYTLDLSRTPPPVEYELPILGSIGSDSQLAIGAAADD